MPILARNLPKLPIFICPVCGAEFVEGDGRGYKFQVHLNNEHGLCSCLRPLQDHPVCRACGIFLGKGHVEEEIFEYEGNTFCRDCFKSWQIAQKRGISLNAFISGKVPINEEDWLLNSCGYTK